MGYIEYKDERIRDEYVEDVIMNGEFEQAYLAVCMFITDRVLEDVHKRIIKHKSRYHKTLDLAPRGFGKSTIGDVDYCITKILRNPNIRIMIGSKTQTQAESFLKEIRLHFEENPKLRRIFGDLVNGDDWSNKQFTVNSRTQIKKESTLTALGASGQVVSKHFDIIIGDDIVGFENARTETQREKLEEWFYSSLLPTLEPHGELHILGTRYHPLDLYQTFIDSGNYHTLIQQAINENKDGEKESLWADKFPLEELEAKKKEAGSIIFNMQYQNNVEMAKGEIFKPHYFEYYDNYNINSREKEVYVELKEGKRNVDVYFGVDLAISQDETADYFVLMVIGVDHEENVFVLDYVKDRRTFDEQFNTIIRYGKKFPMVQGIGIESNAYQASMAQELKRSSTLPIHKIHTQKDKVSRAMRRSAIFENGKVYFRDNMDDFEEQLLLFPDVEHDDIFDGFDFAVHTLEKSSNVEVLDRRMFNI